MERACCQRRRRAGTHSHCLRRNSLDHRLSRPLHDRPAGAGGLARPADRRPHRPGHRAPPVRPAHQRRRAAREHRGEPAPPDGRPRDRHDDLLAARLVHGPPHRRLQHLRAVGGHLQRALPPGRHPVPGAVRARRDASAVARRRPGHLRPGTDPVRRGVRRRRREPQPRPVGRPLDRAAADRPLLVPRLREDGRVRHPGDGARQHQRQPGLPHHRRALPQRRHHRVHAARPGRPVRRLPHPAPGHPARRRRRALPLGPLPRSGDGAEASHRWRNTSWATSSSTPASTTSPASICCSTSSPPRTSCSPPR